MRELSTATALEERQVDVTWLKAVSFMDASLRQRHRNSIFLINDEIVLDHFAQTLLDSPRRMGSLVVLFCPRAQILPCLYRSMDRVIYMDASGALSPRNMMEILKLPDRGERFLGILNDSGSGTITFWRGDLKPLVVSLEWLEKKCPPVPIRSSGLRITEVGRTLEMHGGKIFSHEILCDLDAEFRRVFRLRQWAAEDSLGARVRLLRKEMGLRREDFPGIDAKTVARIERNEIRQPQRETLRLIAQTLGLSCDNLYQYIAA